MDGTLDVIIPVFKKKNHLKRLLKALKKQTLKASKIIIVYAEGTEVPEDKEYLTGAGATLLSAGTSFTGEVYNTGLKESTGDMILFLDPDVFLTSEDMAEKLAEDLWKERTAAAFCRLIPSKKTPAKQRAAQHYLYPETSEVYDLKSVLACGVRTFMHRNIVSLVNARILKETGSYEMICLSYAEYLWCARVLYAGYSVYYDGQVKAGFDLPAGLFHDLKESFELAALKTMYPQVLGLNTGMALKTEEGTDSLLNVTEKDIYRAQYRYIKDSLKKKPGASFGAGLSCRAKCLGALLGRYYFRLPLSMNRKLCLHTEYWTGI